ncbi:MAG: hypothetical protein GTN36_02715 [Candidatus Aenigmarchaeota archaeon]|nr:hypothetical protein [Candidatus Aenigmarchaeota archaeon]
MKIIFNETQKELLSKSIQRCITILELKKVINENVKNDIKEYKRLKNKLCPNNDYTDLSQKESVTLTSISKTIVNKLEKIIIPAYEARTDKDYTEYISKTKVNIEEFNNIIRKIEAKNE